MPTLCIYNNCKKYPSFNYPENKKRLYCSKHKKDGMIFTRNKKKCIEKKCNTAPIFNYDYEKTPKYCSKHKKNGMIDIKNKKCIENNCIKRAHYNYIYEKKLLYCLNHKKDGMINLSSRKCIEKECIIQPVYNYPNEKKGIYCSIHKKDGMINIKSTICNENNCNKQASYNYKNNKKKLYCSVHKKDGMINISSKKCIEKGCNTSPIYNFKGFEKALYCKKHKKDNMIDIRHKKCQVYECNIRANYNYENKTKGIYCSKHKKDGMIDIKNKRCKAEYGCYTLANKKYKGYCLRCFQYLFPDVPITRNYKTKEREVVNFIKNNFSNYDWITDKKIANGCSNRRPDLYIDLGYQIIIIEIDEDQHNQYDCSCENKRLMEISQDFGHRPLIFIRFNPDKYTTLENKNNNSCWKIKRDTGRCMISRKTEWKRRLNILKNQVSYWLNEENKTNKTVEIVHLFFNGFD